CTKLCHQKPVDLKDDNTEKHCPVTVNPWHMKKAFKVMNELRRCTQTVETVENDYVNCRHVRSKGERDSLTFSAVTILCNSEMSESRAKRVRIKEVDGWTLRMLIDYVYTAEIQVTEENVQLQITWLFEDESNDVGVGNLYNVTCPPMGYKRGGLWACIAGIFGPAKKEEVGNGNVEGGIQNRDTGQGSAVSKLERWTGGGNRLSLWVPTPPSQWKSTRLKVDSSSGDMITYHCKASLLTCQHTGIHEDLQVKQPSTVNCPD
ncbi:Kelch-like protein 2, partial [Chelonia mydas]